MSILRASVVCSVSLFFACFAAASTRAQDLPAGTAVSLLRKRLWEVPVSDYGPHFRRAIRTPLYFRLAADVCLQDPVPGADLQSLLEVHNYLWDKYLDQRLATSDSANLSWRPTTVRRWLHQYAAAAERQQVKMISFRSWPLLYGPRVRRLLRVLKAVLCATLVSVFAMQFVRGRVVASVFVATLVLFSCANEGAVTRPMAPQKFGLARFMITAKAQWPYALPFAIAGALFGWLATAPMLEGPLEWLAGGGDSSSVFSTQSNLSTPLGILIGLGAGLLLGFTVPTLYELSYVKDAALYSRRKARSMIVPTLVSASVIGVCAGIVASLAVDVVFRNDAAFLAVPLCVSLAILDTLGLPWAAVVLWALQRKGPIRVDALLSLITEVGLARPFGQFYFLDHSELLEFLGRTGVGMNGHPIPEAGSPVQHRA